MYSIYLSRDKLPEREIYIYFIYFSRKTFLERRNVHVLHLLLPNTFPERGLYMSVNLCFVLVAVLELGIPIFSFFRLHIRVASFWIMRFIFWIDNSCFWVLKRLVRIDNQHDLSISFPGSLTGMFLYGSFNLSFRTERTLIFLGRFRSTVLHLDAEAKRVQHPKYIVLPQLL